ncbi:MAG TPA: hypothetical protein VFK30_01820 [Anaerolineae bacterium]|nr:hypothetical protein [Anaerolineae bacterium]
MKMRSSDFMRALPAAVRPKLPKKLQAFSVNTRAWLVQFYYNDPLLHYEVVTHGDRRGVLEIGLHFESRTSEVNARLLAGFMKYLFEIKLELGAQIEAEMWDKGWTKVYETIELAAFDQTYLEHVADRLAKMIVVLQPIFEKVKSKK